MWHEGTALLCDMRIALLCDMRVVLYMIVLFVIIYQ